MADDRAIRALITAALKVARSAPSGRLGFAQAHAITIPEALPLVLRDRIMAELEAAAATVEPMSSSEVGKLLQRAWGSDPKKLVDELDLETPLAVTAASQVHRGVHDSTPVAIKVLRPGLAESVRSDLQLLDTLAAPASAAFPAVDVPALIREGRERILDELDLEHGAADQRTTARALRRDARIDVPTVVSDLTTHNVLVCKLVTGPTLAGGVPAGADGAAIARHLLRFFLGSGRAIGLVHADADPANVIVTADGIAVVDFAATGRISDTLIDAAADALEALRDDDAEAFAAAAVQRLGLLPDAATARQALAVLREVGGELLTGPAVLDAAALFAVSERAEAHLDALLDLAVRATLAPEHLAPLRMLGTLVPTLARLGVRADWIADGLTAARAGW